MSSANWVGWIWCDGRWWQATQGVTLGECARALSRAADEAAVDDVETIITGGAAPIGPPLSHDY